MIFYREKNVKTCLIILVRVSAWHIGAETGQDKYSVLPMEQRGGGNDRYM